MKKILLCCITVLALLYAHSQTGSLDHCFPDKVWAAVDFKKDNLYSEYGEQVLLTGGYYTVVFEINGYTFLGHYERDGALDKDFGADGFSEPVNISSANAIVQKDGKIVVAGWTYNLTSSYDFAVARYNYDGTLDKSFSGDGKQTTDFFINSDFASSIAIQADGKIIVAGNATNPTTKTDFALARYNPDGSLDSSFDGDGKQTTNFFSGSDIASSVAIQADGKIIVAGSAYNFTTSSNDIALARYNYDGTLDKSFSEDGKRTTDFYGSEDGAASVAIQTDGKIVVAGYTINYTTRIYDFALVRYNTNGSLDRSFDEDGRQTTDFYESYDNAVSVIIQTDGKIVAAGSAYNPTTSSYDFALARYNSNGSLDSSFDRDGKQTTDFFSDDNAFSAAIQTDGKIVVIGMAYNPATGNYDFILARYNTNGSPDNAFDADGKLTGYYPSGATTINAITVQKDGKIVVAGSAYSPTITDKEDFALARYNPNGSLDRSFNRDGRQTTDFYGSYDFANAVRLQKDGKMVVAGSTFNYDSKNNFALARYNPNGSLDSSFGDDGKQAIDFNGSDDFATSLYINDNKYIKDNKLYVAGYTSSPLQRGIVEVYSLDSRCSVAPTASAGENRLENKEALPQSLTVQAQPNPSTQYFTLLLHSISNRTATITITDALGKRIEIRTNVVANSTLQFGHSYRSGMYFAEIVQGSEKVVVKLIKQ